MTHLRRVESESRPALSPDALHERGNELVTKARAAAIDAVRASMHTEFVEKAATVQRRDILRWRARAREALAAWREVESVCTELLNEIDRTDDASRAGMRRAVVPDGSGNPGHYMTAWVKDDDPESDDTEEE